MADEKEKRTLLGDIQKNIIDKIGNENIMEGDITRYKVPKNLPEVPIKTIKKPMPGLQDKGPNLPVTRSSSPALSCTYSSQLPDP